MRVHHLNCATMCPPFGGGLPRGHLIAHVLALETPAGVLLVDTGLGTADLEAPRSRLGMPFLAGFGPTLAREEPALAQLTALGFTRRDVRHIVVTHLDLDHAGGLADFPEATVHVYARERALLGEPLPFRHRQRYRKAHFEHAPRWRDYHGGGDRWFGFESVRVVADVGAEVVLIPLVGHTFGHVGVAVRVRERWLLHAGDAYFHHDELRGERAPLVLEAFQRVAAMDAKQRVHNRDRLAELAGQESVEIFCAHDPDELEVQRVRSLTPG